MEKKNKTYIKNIKEFTGFESTIDFSGNIDKYNTFVFRNLIKEEHISVFYNELINRKEDLFVIYKKHLVLLFKIFNNKILNNKITEKQNSFLNSFNIFFLTQRYIGWVIHDFFNNFEKNDILNSLLFNYQSSSIINYLRNFHYTNNNEIIDGNPIIEINPEFRYNDPYYISFKLTKLRRLRRKLLIGVLRKKAKLNKIINFFCLEGSIGLKGATYANLVKKNKISLLRIAYDLFSKYKIPIKYKKFKKITFKLTRLNQYRFLITKRPEYTLWYKKMESQLLGSKEQMLESLINLQ